MQFFRGRRGRGRPPHPDVLTPAEWRVLEHVRKGTPNAEIAVRLGVSVNTVKTHVSSMLAKLDVADRAELAAWEGEPTEASRKALRGVPSAVVPFLGWLRGVPPVVLAKAAGVTAAVVVLGVGVSVGVALVRGTEGDATPAPAATRPAAAATPPAAVAITPAPAPSPEAFSPTIAPDGRTPDAALNALIESLLSDDAETLERLHGDAAVRESGGGSGESRSVRASEWAARLADARRSLYAVVTAHPQTFPHDFDVVLALSVDGGREGWRFAVDGGRVIEVVILDRPSTTSVAKAYERFVVLPPAEDLPQPEPGYELRLDPPRTGDAGVDSLLAMLWARDGDGLLAAVAFDEGALPIWQCPGELQPRDADYVERRLDDLAEQAYSLHAVAQVPEGYLPAAEHLLIVVREPSPYDFELRGLLEADGRIVGLLTSCVSLPPRAFLVAPPPGGIEDLDPDRRSGIEVLDAVLDAMEANDRAALLGLIDFSEIGCVREQLEIDAPPKCRSGEREGTILDVLLSAGCEGAYSRRDELDWLFDLLLGAEWVLFGASASGESDPGASALARGRVWAVLASTAPEPAIGAIRLNVTGRGIYSVLRGCGPQSPEALLLRFGGDPEFLLAPPAAR